MKNILTSASKLVFVLMALATIVGMLMGKIDAKDFLTLVSMAFTFTLQTRVIQHNHLQENKGCN